MKGRRPRGPSSHSQFMSCHLLFPGTFLRGQRAGHQAPAICRLYPGLEDGGLERNPADSPI